MTDQYKSGRGGKREGAGRPSTGRRERKFWVTDEEHAKMREYLEAIRSLTPAEKAALTAYLLKMRGENSNDKI